MPCVFQIGKAPSCRRLPLSPLSRRHHTALESTAAETGLPTRRRSLWSTGKATGRFENFEKSEGSRPQKPGDKSAKTRSRLAHC